MRFCLCLLGLALWCGAAEKSVGVLLSGHLIVEDGKPAAIETPGHQRVQLDGDTPTRKVLADKRLNGMEVQAKGHRNAAGVFVIDPMHEHALLVRQDGRLKMITYWCDVCSIRAYTPGPCVCCQKETTLDLRDPDDLQ